MKHKHEWAVIGTAMGKIVHLLTNLYPHLGQDPEMVCTRWENIFQVEESHGLFGVGKIGGSTLGSVFWTFQEFDSFP